MGLLPVVQYFIQFFKLCLTLWPHEVHHAGLLCPSLSPWICSDSYPLSQWCHPAISKLLRLLFFLTPFSMIMLFSHNLVKIYFSLLVFHFWPPHILVGLNHLFWWMNQSYRKSTLRSIILSSSQLSCSILCFSYYIFSIDSSQVTNMASGLSFFFFFCTNEKLYVCVLISSSFSPEG